MCPLGCFVRPAGLPGVGSLWASLRPRCEVDVDESLVEGAAGGGAGRQGSPGLPVKWQVSRVGGLGNKGSCCPGRILSLSAFVTMCVTHQRQSGGTTSSNTQFLMTCVRSGCPFIVLGQMWSGIRKMRLTNGMAGFQSLPFLTNQKIISVIFWLVHIIQSDSYVNSQSNLIGAESCDLIGLKSSIFIGCW